MSDAVLVVGGSGFIGRHLVRELLCQGRDVIILAREMSEVDDFSGKVKIYRTKDWTKDALLLMLRAERFGSVLNLASYGVNPKDRDPHLSYAVNVELPVALTFVAAAHKAVLILAGSCSEYSTAEVTCLITEDNPLERQQLYGSSKAAGGVAATGVAHALNVPVVVLRLFNVYGAGEAKHRLLPTLLAGLSSGERVPLSEGRQVRDFVFVQDVVEALLAAEHTLKSKSKVSLRADYNVATGIGHSVREFCASVGAALGASPQLLGYGDYPIRPGEVPRLVGSSEAFSAFSGWEAKTILAAGIAKVIAHAAMKSGE